MIDVGLDILDPPDDGHDRAIPYWPVPAGANPRPLPAPAPSPQAVNGAGSPSRRTVIMLTAVITIIYCPALIYVLAWRL